MRFELESPFKPQGDQPKAIEGLTSGLVKGFKHQTLLGATGTGKTFVMANLITQLQKPTLVIAHNKTLAAQLASEFRTFFPKNAVHYFVSYYDYYQPEAYIPRSDTYIEKETQLNEEIDRLRHASTESLLSRTDVIVVASVSCIYGLGSPIEYKNMRVTVHVGLQKKREKVLHELVALRYQRNDIDFVRGTFRVRGDSIEIYPAAASERAWRVEFFGDEVERITEIEALTGESIATWESIDIYPATHYVAPMRNLEKVLNEIEGDMKAQVATFERAGKLIEAQRIGQRVKFDLEMIREVGYVNGIENYSRYFDQREVGEPPFTLLDYFPPQFLTFIDESHMTIPQIRGMYEGDRSRKQVLIDYGFRLPAAFDNRPLKFGEFSARIDQTVYVSATPEEYELRHSAASAQPPGQVVELLIRPTGLLDPVIEVKPINHQVDDLIKQIRGRLKKHQRVIVTTLTKRLAEELTEYLKDIDIKVQYLHSEIDTLERLEILRDLRLGVYDVVVGINLLREGLDLPEVSLVAILDADKEGFLRSRTSLIQTIGRAARHIDGKVIMYADRITRSMKAAIEETTRRRSIQETYNKKHGITPASIQKKIKDDRLSGAKVQTETADLPLSHLREMSAAQFKQLMHDLENKMELAAKNLEFEQAAVLRDQIQTLRAAFRKRKKL